MLIIFSTKTLPYHISRICVDKSTEYREQSTENREQMKDESLCQASESQVYLSFYSERSQGSSPRSGVNDDR